MKRDILFLMLILVASSASASVAPTKRKGSNNGGNPAKVARKISMIDRLKNAWKNYEGDKQDRSKEVSLKRILSEISEDENLSPDIQAYITGRDGLGDMFQWVKKHKPQKFTFSDEHVSRNHDRVPEQVSLEGGLNLSLLKERKSKRHGGGEIS